MRKNIWIKAASIIIAVVLWLFVLSRGYSDISMRVPIGYNNVPQGLQVDRTGAGTTRTTAVGIAGHDRLLKTLSPGDVRVSLDLKGVEKGEYQFKITRNNLTLPKFVRLKSLTPSDISVKVEKTRKKAVPVSATIVGQPAEGFTLVRVKVEPGKMKVEGIESALKALKVIRTAPVDVSGATEGFTEHVAVERLGKGLVPEAETVAVKVSIKEDK